MKSLTVLQPWAGAIAYGAKRIENRSWPIPRGDVGQAIAIHAAKSIDLGAVPPDGESWPAGQWAVGAILAAATLKGCHHASKCASETGLCSPWAQQGQFHWELAEVRPIAEPVPCRGFQKLWTVPEQAEAAVLAQLAGEAGYSAAWQVVTCRDCGSTYQCTPGNDYHARPGETITGPGDGLCLACLVGPVLAPATRTAPKETPDA